jgi:predicted nucleotidyltransferase component of viral defense system
MSESDRGQRYERQVRLLIETLPYVMIDPRFALKGGTAINLFVRNLPRFSVDIDLTYLPVEPRAETIRNINDLLKAAAHAIEKAMPTCKVRPTRSFDSGQELKLLIEREGTTIKVEANYILRGFVLPAEVHTLVKDARERFEVSTSVQSVSLADLYGGKICAALDRQHPRDLFDIKLLLENEGITNAVRHAFLVYLMSHNRPMNELWDPKWQDMDQVFANEFAGMTTAPVTVEELKTVRHQLLAALYSGTTDAERTFLLSFKAGRADWKTFPYPHVEHLPGIKWKQMNLKKLSAARLTAELRRLEKALSLRLA